MRIRQYQRYHNSIRSSWVFVNDSTALVETASNRTKAAIYSRGNNGCRLSSSSKTHMTNRLPISSNQQSLVRSSEEIMRNYPSKRKQHLSSSSSSSLSHTGSNKGRRYSGTVKFYLREKGYGFIVPDMNNDDANSNNRVDVFVHHSALVTSVPKDSNTVTKENSYRHDNHSDDSNCNDKTTDTIQSNTSHYAKRNFLIHVRYPFLRPGERVQYSTKRESNGTIQAVDVRWLNGTPIPPLRRNYLGGVHERSKIILGNSVYHLIQQYHMQHNDGNSRRKNQPFTFDMLDQNQLSTLLMQLQNYYNEADETIRFSEDLIESLGMNIQDFPIIKSMDTKRGKYDYDD